MAISLPSEPALRACPPMEDEFLSQGNSSMKGQAIREAQARDGVVTVQMVNL